MVRDLANVARFLATAGEATEVPRVPIRIVSEGLEGCVPNLGEDRSCAAVPAAGMATAERGTGRRSGTRVHHRAWDSIQVLVNTSSPNHEASIGRLR